MPRMRVVAALLTLLLLPATAQAHDLQAETQAARQRWAEQGITGCEAGISASYVQGVPAGWTDGQAWGGDCATWYREVPVMTGDVPLEDGWDNHCGEYFRMVVEHEVGHALGLKHNDPRFPIMTESVMEPTTECDPVTLSEAKALIRTKLRGKGWRLQQDEVVRTAYGSVTDARYKCVRIRKGSRIVRWYTVTQVDGTLQITRS